MVFLWWAGLIYIVLSWRIPLGGSTLKLYLIWTLGKDRDIWWSFYATVHALNVYNTTFLVILSLYKKRQQRTMNENTDQPARSVLCERRHGTATAS